MTELEGSGDNRDEGGRNRKRMARSEEWRLVEKGK